VQYKNQFLSDVIASVVKRSEAIPSAS